MNFEKLSSPFPEDLVHWRAQTLTRDKEKALALAYIDARDVMERLDDVAGPANWTDYYDESASGRVICKLSILIDGQWVTKSDGAGSTAVEAEKGGISDAFKRAGVKWGIGRYLYDCEAVWAPCTTYNDKWNGWKPEAAAMFKKALQRAGKPTGPISDTTRDWLIAQMQSADMLPGALLDHFKPKDLRDLTFDQMPEAKRFIENIKKQRAA